MLAGGVVVSSNLRGGEIAKTARWRKTAASLLKVSSGHLYRCPTRDVSCTYSLPPRPSLVSVETYDPWNPSGINIPSLSLGFSRCRWIRGTARALTALQNKCSSSAPRAGASSLWLSAAELWIRICRELIGINTVRIPRTLASFECRSRDTFLVKD